MSSAPTPRSPESSPGSLEPEKDAIQTQLEDGPVRGLAYAARLRTFILASSRYVAYTSDIGEAFRPLVTPGIVRAAYAVSWLYLGGDVSYAGYRTWKTGAGHHSHASTPAPAIDAPSSSSSALPDKDELRRRLQDVKSTQDAKQAASALSSEVSRALTPTAPAGGAAPSEIAFVMARRAVFQALASMMLPAFTIHSVVRYSAPLFARSASRRLASLGPTISGLACVPALPFIFDHPVEQAVDIVFDKVEEIVLNKGEADAVPEEKKKV